MLTSGPPVVTYGLIAACVLVYALQLLIPMLTRWGAFMPVLGLTEPWRFVTVAFLHSPQQPMHLLFNMFCLWQLGIFLELALGRAGFLATYLLCAVGGSVGFMWISAGVTDPSSTWFAATVGASGAVFGLFGVMLVLLRRLGGSTRPVVVFLVLNAAMPLVFPGIAWQAHVGGFLTGVAIASLLALVASRPAARAATRAWLAWSGVGIVVLVLAALKYVLVIGGLTL